jgi:hypothetical protein
MFLRASSTSPTGFDWALASSTGGSAVWGGITGTLSNQTDLQAALDAKLSTTSAASTYVSFNYASSTFATAASLLADYVSTSTLSSTLSAYLSTTTAVATYPSFTYASNTFATLSSLTNDYVSTSTLSSTLAGYLSTTSAAADYVSTGTAASTYVTYGYGSSTYAFATDVPTYSYATSTFATIASLPLIIFLLQLNFNTFCISLNNLSCINLPSTFCFNFTPIHSISIIITLLSSFKPIRLHFFIYRNRSNLVSCFNFLSFNYKCGSKLCNLWLWFFNICNSCLTPR